MPNEGGGKRQGKARRDSTIRAAWIAAGAVVVAALVGAGIPLIARGQGSAGGSIGESPLPTSTQTKSAEGPSLLSNEVRITEPKQGARVYGNANVLFEGTAHNPVGTTLWIFVQRYGIYYVSDDKPIAESGGKWVFHDSYVGNSANPGMFYVSAVLANGLCVKTIISAKQQQGGGVSFKALPNGCHISDTIGIERVSR